MRKFEKCLVLENSKNFQFGKLQKFVKFYGLENHRISEIWHFNKSIFSKLDYSENY